MQPTLKSQALYKNEKKKKKRQTKWKDVYYMIQTYFKAIVI